MKGPAFARAGAKAKGKTTTKGIGKDKGKESARSRFFQGKGKGKEGNGKGKARQGQEQERTCANNPLATLMLQQWNIDEDDAARAAIRAEADAIPESTVEAMMVEARTRDALMLILDMHRLFANQHGRDHALPLLRASLTNLVTATARIRARLLDSADMNAD